MRKGLTIVITAAITALLCACLAACDGNSKEIEALSAHTWYITDSSDNAVNVVRFTDGEPTLTTAYVDGNGAHQGTEQTGTLEFDDGKVVLTFGGEGKFEISYTFENDEMKLDSSQALNESQVLEKLQGNWNKRITDYVLGITTVSEYNLTISGKNIDMENAYKAQSGGGYYYYGPYSGTFELGNGTLESDMEQSNEFFFRVQDGDVQLFRFSDQLSKGGNGLVGENGYSF